MINLQDLGINLKGGIEIALIQESEKKAIELE
jgi:hypothetical protein